MAYSTPATVRLVLSSTAGEYGGTAADLSDEQIQYEIDGASADIDARLRNRYQVPFEPDTPRIITQICTDLAAYKADLNFRKSREYDNDNMPIILRHKDAERLLEGIRRGRNTLDWPRTSGEDFGSIVVHPCEGPLLTYWGSVSEFLPRW